MQMYDRATIAMHHIDYFHASFEIEHFNNVELNKIVKRLKQRDDISIYFHSVSISDGRITHTIEQVIDFLKKVDEQPEVKFEEFKPDIDAKVNEKNDIGTAIREMGWYWHEAGVLDNEEDEWEDQEQFKICGWGFDHYERALHDHGDHIDSYGWCYNSHGSCPVMRINRNIFLKRLAECREFCQKYQGHNFNFYKAYQTVIFHIIRKEDITKESATW